MSSIIKSGKRLFDQFVFCQSNTTIIEPPPRRQRIEQAELNYSLPESLLDSLPEELITRILSFLDFDSLLNIQWVARKWCRIVRIDFLTKPIFKVTLMEAKLDYLKQATSRHIHEIDRQINPLKQRQEAVHDLALLTIFISLLPIVLTPPVRSYIEKTWKSIEHNLEHSTQMEMGYEKFEKTMKYYNSEWTPYSVINS
jgi:hypothetical protein